MPTIKRTPGFSIFTYPGRSILYVRYQGRRITTGLHKSPIGIMQAEKLGWEIYWKDQEERRGLSPKTLLTDKPTVAEAFTEFVHERQNRAPRTRKDYDRALREVMGDQAGETLTDELVADRIRAYARRQDHAVATRELVLRTFHIFTSWACEEKEWLNKTHKFRHLLEATVPREPRAFTAGQMHNLIAYFDERDGEFAILLRLLYITGFRIGRALAITPTMITEKRIAGVSKNRRRRRDLGVTPELYALLEPILSRSRAEKRSWLFRWGPESSSRLGKWLRDACDELKIPRADGQLFHAIRRAAAERIRRLLKEGKIDLVTAGNYMDHSIEVMRERYLDDDIEGLASVTALMQEGIDLPQKSLLITEKKVARKVQRA